MTDPKPDLVVERIRALDQALAGRAIDARAREEIRERLAREATTRPLATKLRWWPALAFAAGAVLMALVQLGPRESGDASREPRAAVPSPAIAPSPAPLPCAPLHEGHHLLAAGECRAGDGITLHATRTSTLEFAEHRLELDMGELELAVDPRARPLHVLSGDRDIEVIGTRFVVHQQPEGGWVVLLEGRIHLHQPGHATIGMTPGDRHGWASASASEHASEAAQARPRPRSRERSDEDEQLPTLLAEVAALRRAGQFEQAVARLRSVDTSRWSTRARQLVSYEIGTLLERQLGDREAACTHWRAHASEFPQGRHAQAVASALARLECE